MSVKETDDLLMLLEDDPEMERPAGQSWKILVVDDDHDVHRTTEFSLQNEIIENRGLQFLHAYSAHDGLVLLAQHADIALLILDVVMESENAGLEMVKTIRGELKQKNLRIVLRTGQPGYAPEIEVIRNYDINDYKTKSELTRIKLFTTVTTAIRSYQQLCQIDSTRHGLELLVQASQKLYVCACTGIHDFTQGIITQIAAFLQVEPEGVVCVQGRRGDKEIVVAAAGGMSQYIQKDLSEINDSRLIASVREAFSSRRNVYTDNSVSLYFDVKSGQTFTVYIAANSPVVHENGELLKVFCSNISTMADNAQLYEHMRDLAYSDPLLNIPNRHALLEKLEQLLQVPEGLALALIDIDEFAETNETFGHEYADALLKSVATRLQHDLPPECGVARIGADVFAVTGFVTTVNPAVLRTLLQKEFPVLKGKHHASFSMGFLNLESNSSPREALQNASVALKMAKGKGPGNDSAFSNEISQDIRSRTHLLHDLRKAVRSEKLFMAYQPQFDLASGQLVGFEALMRWRNDDGELVPADRFIPLTEHSGMIIPLGRWVLKQALTLVRALEQQGRPGLRVAVNVSAVQFKAPGLVAAVREALVSTGVAPDQLELELTESISALGLENILSMMKELRSIGVTLAIDDFGTGFSSLSYISQLPLDRLKIDKSFVWMLGEDNNSHIAEMVLGIGQKMGVTVIAEGVETAQQEKRLLQLGCHEVQGYYYAKPMEEKVLMKWISEFELKSPSVSGSGSGNGGA